MCWATYPNGYLPQLSFTQQFDGWHMQAYRLLDRGPPAEAERACAAFRKLWGDHAELRRLPDASIHEAVAWDKVPAHHRSAIPDLIIKHILEKHVPGCKVCCNNALQLGTLRWKYSRFVTTVFWMSDRTIPPGS